MGIELGTAMLISSILGTGTTVATSAKAGRRAKQAGRETEEAQKKLKDEEKVSRAQAAQRITSGRGTGGANPARSTILTGGLDLGGTATGKTLLGE